MTGITITPIQMDGELRILDVNLAERLGFAQPRDIRKLIKRYGAELDRMGQRATVARRPEKGGTATIETYLNKKQAIFITAKSETPEATDITIEIIHKFDAYEQGAHLPIICDEDDEVQTADGLKLRKVNTAARIFGDRAAAQLWAKVGLEMVPAMRPVLAQMDIFEVEHTTVTRMMGASL